MIYEYALDPAVVATWGSRQDFRYFIEKFGLGQPRFVSRYPKRWQRLVWDAYKGQDDFEKARLTELLSRFSERSIHRSSSQYDGGDWLENTLQEHSKKPFRAVVTGESIEGNSFVLFSEDIDDSNPLWSTPRSVVVPRCANKMAQLLAPLLSSATKIIFVDPHFGPENLRYRKTLQAYLQVATANRESELKSVEVHTQVKSSESFFRDNCQRKLTKIIPKGTSVTFLRWTSKEGGQSLHNRYILTDLGGVSFQHGLDEGREGDTDDVTILGRENYILRWSQYDSNSDEFVLAEEPFELIGQ